MLRSLARNGLRSRTVFAIFAFILSVALSRVPLRSQQPTYTSHVKVVEVPATVLERMSKETGGRLFEVSKKQPVDEIYMQIADELRYQYDLGYTPDRADLTGYHKIHLAAKQKELEVQREKATTQTAENALVFRE